MRICIITLYNSSNYGAYLQAFALSRYFKTMGIQARFIKHKARKPLRSLVKRVLVDLKKGKLQVAYFDFLMLSKIILCQRRFEYISITNLKHNDLVVIGSDELWNVKKDIISKYPIMFGIGVNNKKIAYAPSVNDSEAKDFNKYHDLVDGICSCDSIAVRDKKSQKVVNELTGKEIVTVVDPTLLIGIDYYKQISRNCGIRGRYILLYSYGYGFEDEDSIGTLLDYAYANDLKVVSILRFLTFANNIPLSPFQVLDAFDKANVVAADTFHGIMFSLIFRKNLVIPKVTSAKLKEAITLFCLEDRVVSEKRTFEEIADTEIDFRRIDKILTMEISKSKAYLNQFITL